MKTNLLFTIGNDMMGDDAAGPLLARMIQHSPLAAWEVMDGGSAPENYVYKIRECAPERVVIVDAADMQLEAGAIRMIDREHIGSVFLLTTHALPLSFLIESLGEFVPTVELIGIQPDVVAFGYPVSPPVEQGVRSVYAWLQSGGQSTDVERAIVDLDACQGGDADEIDRSAPDRTRSGLCSPGEVETLERGL